jgi:glutamate synthase (NADPH/NADH) small chain
MPRRVQPSIKSPKERIGSFSEVISSYNLQQAITEASRCFSCYNPPCQRDCPPGIDIAEFIDRIKTGDTSGAVDAIREENALPGICGRACPVEELCEKNCVRKNVDKEAVAIGALQRFAADHEKLRQIRPNRLEPSGKKVAAIGSGPASLATASELLKMGYKVTMFESRSVPGGLLGNGIPSYRLPRDVVDWEVGYIKEMGVEVLKNRPVKRIGELLREGFGAVFVGIGMTKSASLNIPGEDLKDVYQGLEFLEAVSKGLADEVELPSLSKKKVIVIGGGDVAIDAARCSLRLGADIVTVVYRRSFEEMPAHRLEIKAASDEGVEFLILSAPVKILGRERAEGVECMKMELGPLDESGRRRPLPIPGSEFLVHADVVIEAIGQRLDEEFIRENPEIKTSGGSIIVDERTGMTSKPGVFAGGDAVGGGTVVQAIAEGKIAAKNINEYLKGSLR